MVRALSHVFFFNPGPVRRVPIPNRYTAKAKLCFCKNNKRRIIMVAAWVIGATDITAGAARPLGARPVMTLAGTSNVVVSPLALLLAFILTTSLCPSRGTMLLCARLSKPTARPPT